MSECGTQIARIPTACGPCTSSKSRSPTYAARLTSTPTARGGRAERLGVRLGPGDLAGVHVGVDEVEHAVTLEDGPVVLPRPRSCSKARRPGSLARAGLPTTGGRRSSVNVWGSQNVRYAARAASWATCEGSSPASWSSSRSRALLPSSRPARHARSSMSSRRAVSSAARAFSSSACTWRGEALPLRGDVDGVPRRQRAAPVEDDRLRSRPPPGGLLAGRTRCRGPRPRRSAARVDGTAHAARRCARSRSSSTPSATPRPTTTIVGTPMQLGVLELHARGDLAAVVVQDAHADGARAPATSRRPPRRRRRPCRSRRRGRRPGSARRGQTRPMLVVAVLDDGGDRAGDARRRRSPSSR